MHPIGRQPPNLKVIRYTTRISCQGQVINNLLVQQQKSITLDSTSCQRSSIKQTLELVPINACGYKYTKVTQLV